MGNRIGKIGASTWMTTDGNNIWYLTADGGSLMSVSLHNGEVGFLSGIPDVSIKESAYRSMAYYDDAILIFPYYSRKIWKYDLKTNDISCIIGSKKKSDLPKAPLIFGSVFFNGRFYMYGPHSYVYTYDPKTGYTAVIDMKDVNTAPDSPLFWKYGFVTDGHLMLPMANREAVVVMSDTDHYRVEWGKDEKWYSTIMIPYNDKICFIGVQESGYLRVDILDYKSNSIDRLCEKDHMHDLYIRGRAPFSGARVINDMLCIMPGSQPRGYTISLENGNITEFDITDPALIGKKNTDIISGLFIDDDYVCIDNSDSSLITRSAKTGICKRIKLFASDDTMKRLFSELNDKNGLFIKEDAIMTLGSFITSMQ